MAHGDRSALLERQLALLRQNDLEDSFRELQRLRDEFVATDPQDDQFETRKSTYETARLHLLGQLETIAATAERLNTDAGQEEVTLVTELTTRLFGVAPPVEQLEHTTNLSRSAGRQTGTIPKTAQIKLEDIADTMDESITNNPKAPATVEDTLKIVFQTTKAFMELSDLGGGGGNGGGGSGLSKNVNLRNLGITEGPKFSGDGRNLSARKFLMKIADLKRLNKWTSLDTSIVVQMSMTPESPAKRWIETLQLQSHPALERWDSPRDGDDSLRKQFVARWHVGPSYAERAALYDSLKFGPQHADLLSFFDECTSASYIIDSSLDQDEDEKIYSRREIREREANTCFVLGSPPHIREELARNNAKTTQEIKTVVGTIIAMQRAKKGTSLHSAPKIFEVAQVDEHPNDLNVEAVTTRSRSRGNARRGMPNRGRGGINRGPSNRFSNQQKRNEALANGTCFNCFQVGHFKAECPKLKGSRGNFPNGNRPSGGPPRGFNAQTTGYVNYQTTARTNAVANAPSPAPLHSEGRTGHEPQQWYVGPEAPVLPQSAVHQVHQLPPGDFAANSVTLPYGAYGTSFAN